MMILLPYSSNVLTDNWYSSINAQHESTWLCLVAWNSLWREAESKRLSFTEPLVIKTVFCFTMALPTHSGPRPLIQFRNHFSRTVGLLGRVISPSQGRYLNIGQHKHRINAYTDIHALSGIQTHDPSVQASKDSSCLRPRGHCDRLIKTVP
jgi:hypothetical protein